MDDDFENGETLFSIAELANQIGEFVSSLGKQGRIVAGYDPIDIEALISLGFQHILQPQLEQGDEVDTVWMKKRIQFARDHFKKHWGEMLLHITVYLLTESVLLASYDGARQSSPSTARRYLVDERTLNDLLINPLISYREREGMQFRKQGRISGGKDSKPRKVGKRKPLTQNLIIEAIAKVYLENEEREPIQWKRVAALLNVSDKTLRAFRQEAELTDENFIRKGIDKATTEVKKRNSN